ncbi:MAG: polymer-forming cytoskeletal protein [Hyphomicrobium sp.]|nr:polymer-forming cytoskeletal protein [Hyphomicrobium sp.]
MFNTKKADGASAASGSPGKSSEPALLPSARLTPAYEKTRTSNHSIVDECLAMKGDLESAGDILVKGKVLGNIKCKVLIIDTDALVEGGVEAEEVIIRGNSKGTINAGRVRLEKTATVDSEICHQTFSAEEGARIKGALRCKEDPVDGEADAVVSTAESRPAKTASVLSVVPEASA